MALVMHNSHRFSKLNEKLSNTPQTKKAKEHNGTIPSGTDNCKNMLSPKKKKKRFPSQTKKQENRLKKKKTKKQTEHRPSETQKKTNMSFILHYSERLMHEVESSF